MRLVFVTFENNLDTTSWPNHSVSRVLRIVIFVHVVSFMTSTGKLILVLGFGRYFNAFWNVYDCTNLGVPIGTIFCWWLIYTRSPLVDDGGSGGTLQEHEHLESLDPIAIAGGFLSVATVTSFLRLLFLCQLDCALGPAFVSLLKVPVDFGRFVVLFGAVQRRSVHSVQVLQRGHNWPCGRKGRIVHQRFLYVQNPVFEHILSSVTDCRFSGNPHVHRQ